MRFFLGDSDSFGSDLAACAMRHRHSLFINAMALHVRGGVGYFFSRGSNTNGFGALNLICEKSGCSGFTR
jgi:hypothetical protein